MTKECEYRPGIRRQIQEIDLVILLVFIGIMLFSVINYQFFDTKITATTQNYGFMVMAIFIIFIEIVPTFFSPMLPLIVNISSGFNPFLSIIIATFASTIGSLIGFELGKKYGFRYICVLFKPEQWIKAEKFLEKYGRIFMVFAALTPLPYFPLIFGALDIKRKDFIFFGVLSRAIGIIISGYLFLHGINLFN